MMSQTRKDFEGWWSEHHKERRPEKVEEAAWMIWQPAAATAIMAPEAAEDLYYRLHTMSKELESNGIIDEMKNRKAYGAILDAMALVMKFR